MSEEEKISRELAEIQSRVPKEWREKVVEEVDATPTIKMVMEKALELESVPTELKEKIQILRDNGEFTKKKIVENPKIAKLINGFILREINKKIKKGLLPPRSKARGLESIKKIYEKVHSEQN
jgi:hypothetical protein